MSETHDHDHGYLRAGERHKGRLVIAFAIIAGFFFVEAAAGFWTNSLALLSDAGHMLTDVIGLGMALAAIQMASNFAKRNEAHPRQTFGMYRLEILAAFVNAFLLFGVAIWVLVEAVRRIFFTADDEVLSGGMLVVAILGLLANLAAFLLLREGSKESINVEGAYLEVLADAIGSVGVIIGALAIRWLGWAWIDPVIGAAIGLWILPRTARLGRKAVNILIQAAPAGIDVSEVHEKLSEIPGIVDVHDLHLWTLTSDMDAASAHLMTSNEADPHAVLDAARDLLIADYHIDHSTFQVEPDCHTGCDEVSW